MEANKYLVNLPGSMGDYFSSFPTKPELDNQKVAIAKYFTEIDTSRASDKLILIKNEDEALYNEIIQMMVKTSMQIKMRIHIHIKIMMMVTMKKQLGIIMKKG